MQIRAQLGYIPRISLENYVKTESGIPNQLKSIRTRLQMSQQDLAMSAGVARQTIGGIEAGLFAPSAIVALRIAKSLGCHVEDIFWLPEEKVTIQATPARSLPVGREGRLSIARIQDRWVAHSLHGDAAFRSEMIPADGVGTQVAGNEWLEVTLLDDLEAISQSVVIAGCAPALSLWARSSERWFPELRVHWLMQNSYSALQSLARGEVHAAGIHLYDAKENDFNAPFVRKLFPAQKMVLVNLGIWDEGLIVPAGNPKGISSVAELVRPDIKIVNREEGSGARNLLDSFLTSAGINTSKIHGYSQSVSSHQLVAQAIANGQADTGVSASSIASVYGLDFISLQKVRYDLAMHEETLDFPPIQKLLSTLQHRWIRTQLAHMGGYNTSQCGEIITVR